MKVISTGNDNALAQRFRDIKAQSKVNEDDRKPETAGEGSEKAGEAVSETKASSKKNKAKAKEEEKEEK